MANTASIQVLTGAVIKTGAVASSSGKGRSSGLAAVSDDVLAGDFSALLNQSLGAGALSAGSTSKTVAATAKDSQTGTATTGKKPAQDAVLAATPQAAAQALNAVAAALAALPAMPATAAPTATAPAAPQPAARPAISHLAALSAQAESAANATHAANTAPAANTADHLPPEAAKIAAAQKSLPDGAKNDDPAAISSVGATDPGSNVQGAQMQAGFAAALDQAQQQQNVAPAQLTVNAPVGSPGWSAELGEKVVWMAGNIQPSASLHLNPPQLGPVEVHLSVDGSQVNAVFVSHNEAVRDAIQASLPQLRTALADGGMSLGQTQVSADNSGGNAWAGQQQQSGQRQAASAFVTPVVSTPDGPALAGLGSLGAVDRFV